MGIVAILILFALVTLFTCLQTLYLEGMRLRTRDFPSLQFFKNTVEPRLSLRSEEGALTFSLWKHTCLVAMTIAILGRAVDGGTMNPAALGEALAGSLLLMLLSGYLIPQLMFRRTSGQWLNAFAPFFAGSALVVRPLVLLLNFLHSLLEIVKKEPEREEPATPAENIEALISAGAEEGLIEEDDRKLIQSVVEFGDTVAREIMTPRPNMVTIQADATLQALHELVVHEQFSRIPVYGESLDDMVGFVHVRDMFEVAESSRTSRKVRELMRKVSAVPETKPVNDLMREMQQEGTHMVIVIDEYGQTAGLVTMEDVVEVILGEIRDEHEPDSDVQQDEQGGFIVSGNFDLARLPDLLEFRANDDIESTTVGGLIMEWLGRVPKPGEAIERAGLRAEVLASDELRVEQVRLSKVAEPVAQPEGSAEGAQL